MTDPERIELSRDEHTLFVTDEDAARVSVIDLARGKSIASIPVGHEPEGVRLSPNGQWLLVTSETDNNVAIIDPATHKVLHTVLVGTRPRDIAFSADSCGRLRDRGGRCLGLPRRAARRAPRPRRSSQLRKEARPMGIVMDAPRERLYVSTGRGGTVAAHCCRRRQAGARGRRSGARPWGLALTPDGRRLVSANGTSGDVTVLDTDTLASSAR